MERRLSPMGLFEAGQQLWVARQPSWNQSVKMTLGIVYPLTHLCILCQIPFGGAIEIISLTTPATVGELGTWGNIF